MYGGQLTCVGRMVAGHWSPGTCFGNQRFSSLCAKKKPLVLKAFLVIVTKGIKHFLLLILSHYSNFQGVSGPKIRISLKDFPFFTPKVTAKVIKTFLEVFQSLDFSVKNKHVYKIFWKSLSECPQKNFCLSSLACFSVRYAITRIL